MPEWWVERGIGESRFALVDQGRIVEARIEREGIVPHGTVLPARLKTRNPRAIALAGGEEYLLPKGAHGITEGGALFIEVTREKLAGDEPWKRPLARLTDALPGPPTAADLTELPFPSAEDALDAAGWGDLMEEARSGIVGFAGGELRIVATPAMTLIDVDGSLSPADLAIHGAAAAAKAIRRLDIGGSIGIDLPTVQGKDSRQAAAQALDSVLPPPFERTAVNGFGFLQVVRPRHRASLIELASDRAEFEARVLLRRTSRHVGRLRLAGHPALIAVLERHPEWIERISRQVGGSVDLRADASLAMSGGHAEPV